MPSLRAISCSVSTTSADGQARLPVRQHRLGGLAEVTRLQERGRDRLRVLAGRDTHRAHRELARQTEVDAGMLGRDLALAQVADRRQLVVRGLAQQRGHPVDQRQPPPAASRSRYASATTA